MPPNEAPGPTVNVGTGRKAVCAEANEALGYCVLDMDATVARGFGDEISDGIIHDALWHCDADHQIAPKVILDRFYAAVTPDVTGVALVHLARVEFGKTRFRFDDSGAWAVVAPIREAGRFIDLAAFDLDNPRQRGVMRGAGFCVGLDEAQFDARLHPQGRLLVHYEVWSYLRAGCVGALPVAWRPTALHLLTWRVPGLVAKTAADAAKIDLLLKEALHPPPLYIEQLRVVA